MHEIYIEEKKFTNGSGVESFLPFFETAAFLSSFFSATTGAGTGSGTLRGETSVGKTTFLNFGVADCDEYDIVKPSTNTPVNDVCFAMPLLSLFSDWLLLDDVISFVVPLFYLFKKSLIMKFQ